MVLVKNKIYSVGNVNMIARCIDSDNRTFRVLGNTCIFPPLAVGEIFQYYDYMIISDLRYDEYKHCKFLPGEVVFYQKDYDSPLCFVEVIELYPNNDTFKGKFLNKIPGRSIDEIANNFSLMPYEYYDKEVRINPETKNVKKGDLFLLNSDTEVVYGMYLDIQFISKFLCIILKSSANTYIVGNTYNEEFKNWTKIDKKIKFI